MLTPFSFPVHYYSLVELYLLISRKSWLHFQSSSPPRSDKPSPSQLPISHKYLALYPKFLSRNTFQFPKKPSPPSGAVRCPSLHRPNSISSPPAPSSHDPQVPTVQLHLRLSGHLIKFFPLLDPRTPLHCDAAREGSTPETSKRGADIGC